MLWTILDRVVSFTFLLLALTTLVLLLNTTSAAKEGTIFSDKLELFKRETQKVMNNNIGYVDNRLNKLAETQDSYQISTDQRVYILEQRMLQIQAEKKNTQKVIQNNFNTMTNN